MDYKSLVFRRYSCERSSNGIDHSHEEKLSNKENKELSDGEILPSSLQKRFPNEFLGKAIEDIDPFYRRKNVCTNSCKKSLSE